MADAADTAVLDPPVTAGQAEPTGQPQDAAPETPAPAAPETAGGKPPETEPAPAPRSIDDLSDDDLSGHERIQKLIRDREAKAAESARRTSQAEASRNLRQQQLNDFDRGSYQEAFSAIWRKSLETGTDPDPKDLAAVANRFTNVAAYRAAIEGWNALQGGLGDWKWPSELVEESQRIHTEINAGRMHPNELAAFNLHVANVAGDERGYARGMAEGYAKAQKEQAAAAETARLRDTTERAKDAPGPSGISGTPAPVNHTAIINDPSQPMTAKFDAYLAKHGYRHDLDRR